MIKTEKGNVVMGFHGSAELDADFAVITRAVYSSLKRELHMSDEEAKSRARETVEDALNYKEEEADLEPDLKSFLQRIFQI